MLCSALTHFCMVHILSLHFSGIYLVCKLSERKTVFCPLLVKYLVHIGAVSIKCTFIHRGFHRSLPTFSNISDLLSVLCKAVDLSPVLVAASKSG